MERSRQASHLASRSYRGGIPDLGGGDEGAAVSGASAMAEGFAARGDGPTRFGEGRQRGGDSGTGMLDANALPFLGRVGCQG
jgi:hypothetical protein